MVATSYTIVTPRTRYPSIMNNQNQQDVGYYSPEAQTWINPSCDLRSMTSSCTWTPIEGSNVNLLHQLVHQVGVACVETMIDGF